jgi:hypothetical protein
MAIFDSLTQIGLSRFTNRIITVEIVERRIENGSDIICNALVLVKNRSEVTISAKVNDLTIPDLLEWLAKNEGDIVLLFNGDKILHKTLEAAPDGGRPDISRAFGNSLNVSELYIQYYQLAENTFFISITRRQYLDQILDSVLAVKDRIIHVAIGPFPVFCTYKLWYSPSDEAARIEFLNYLFVIDGESLQSFNIGTYGGSKSAFPEREYAVGTETISGDLILPYSFGIYFFLNTLHPVGIDNADVSDSKAQFVYKRLSKPVTMAVAGILFALLIISSAVFSIYRNKYGSLEQLFIQKQEILKASIDKKQVFAQEIKTLEHSGMVKRSQTAFYADQITASMSADIYLRKLVIHTKTSQGDENNIRFDNNRIVIEGNCYSSTDLNEWISHLKAKSWVKDIIISKFTQNDGNDLALFQLEVIKKET